MSGHAVLVHGAWSSPADWRWVEDLLAQRGIAAEAPDLPSHQRADATRADDVERVAEAVAALPGPVVVAGWSYGGAVLTDLDTDALDIARLVYVSSIPGLPPSEESAPRSAAELAPSVGEDEAGPPPSMEPDLSHIIFGDDGTVVLDNDWFVGSDPAVATMPPEVIEHLRSHPRRPLALEAWAAPQVRTAWRNVDTVVVLGRDDNLIPGPQQAWAAETFADVRIIDSDHFSPFRVPHIIADVIAEALS